MALLPLPMSAPTESTVIVPTRRPACVLPHAKSAEWRGAEAEGDTGYRAVEGALAFSIFEIPAVPDFSSHRFPDLAPLDRIERTRRVGARQNQFLAALHTLGPDVGVSLRYFYARPAQGEGCIRVFLIGRSTGPTPAVAESRDCQFRETVRRAFPSEYRLIDLEPRDDELTRRVLGLVDPHGTSVASIVEILKQEQVIPTWHDPADCGFSFYYFPLPFGTGENDMVEFCRALIGDPECRQVVADFTVIPTRPLTTVERLELGRWLRMADQWSRDQRIQVGGGLFSEPQEYEYAADPHAQEVRKGIGDLIQRYGNPEGACFLYAFRILWWDTRPPAQVASALASFALTSGTGYQPIAVGRGHPAFEHALNATRLCYVSAAVHGGRPWGHPEAPETIRRLHRIVDVKEAAGFFRLPIPGRDGCPGIPLDFGVMKPEVAAPAGRRIHLGQFVEGHRVTADTSAFSLDDLTKHSLIVGTPGSGKTTLCMALLSQLWEAEPRIPFLVLEPAKMEYRALKRLPHLHEDLLVFTVGNERISPFRLNPFELIKGVSVSEHISALSTCFAGAFPLWGPLPMILDEAIREAYADRGWSEYDVGGERPDCEPPTMHDFYLKALHVAERTSYRGEVAGNIRGALETRLGSLLRGPKGRCFAGRRSVPVEFLLQRPVVLELDALNEEEKALAMLLTLTLVRDHAKNTRRSGAPLSHVVLLEEAHTVIGQGDGEDRYGEHGNPKATAVRTFVRMLAEMRALGEGLIVADQLPTAIAPEAVKNTNIKVMHRLVAADDRRMLGQAMVLDESQVVQAAVLPSGQSFAFMEGWPRSRLVQERDFKSLHGLEPPPDDSTVRDWMATFPAREDLRDIFLPYGRCGVVCQTCAPRIREESERLAAKTLPSIRRALAEEGGLADPQSTAFAYYLRDFQAPESDRVRWWCAYVHFDERVKPEIRAETRTRA